jgi:hypothetical protein
MARSYSSVSFREEKVKSMSISRLIAWLSIVGNLVTVAFMGFLIHNQAGTLRWVHGLNPFWFFLGAIALIATSAFIAMICDLYRKAKSARTGPQGEVQAASAS